MYVYSLDSLFKEKPRFIINFPTKNHWKEKSQLSYIEDGLKDLIQVILTLNIKSIAIPPLGCGNGGLDWKEVKPLIEEADNFLKIYADSNQRISRIALMIEGFEDSYGMELLSTVHWVCNKEPKAQTAEDVIKAIYNWDENHPKWNERKRSLMPEKDIAIAWKHLDKLGWVEQKKQPIYR